MPSAFPSFKTWASCMVTCPSPSPWIGFRFFFLAWMREVWLMVKQRKGDSLVVSKTLPYFQLSWCSFSSGKDGCGGNAVCVHKVRTLHFNIARWNLWIWKSCLGWSMAEWSKMLLLVQRCRETETGRSKCGKENTLKETLPCILLRLPNVI